MKIYFHIIFLVLLQSRYSIIVFTGKDWSIPTKYSSIKSANLIKIEIFSRGICYDKKIHEINIFL